MAWFSCMYPKRVQQGLARVGVHTVVSAEAQADNGYVRSFRKRNCLGDVLRRLFRRDTLVWWHTVRRMVDSATTDSSPAH